MAAAAHHLRAFDALPINGEDLRALPLLERKRWLLRMACTASFSVAALLNGRPRGTVLADYLRGRMGAILPMVGYLRRAASSRDRLRARGSAPLALISTTTPICSDGESSTLLANPGSLPL